MALLNTLRWCLLSTLALTCVAMPTPNSSIIDRYFPPTVNPEHALKQMTQEQLSEYLRDLWQFLKEPDTSLCYSDLKQLAVDIPEVSFRAEHSYEVSGDKDKGFSIRLQEETITSVDNEYNPLPGVVPTSACTINLKTKEGNCGCASSATSQKKWWKKRTTVNAKDVGKTTESIRETSENVTIPSKD